MAPPPSPDWADAPPYRYHGTLPLPLPLPMPPPEEEEEAPVGGGDPDSARSLWIGGLRHWMNEDYLYSCFTRIPELVSLLIKRNKQTGQSEGFGFLNFADHTAADRVLHSYNGQRMPNAHQDFRLGWATKPHRDKHAHQDFNLNLGTQQDDPSDHAIFVGDLAFDVTDFMLQHLFKTRYPSVKSAKVIFDRATGRSKCYGFVVFGDVNEHRQAMTDMNGAYCSTRLSSIYTSPAGVWAAAEVHPPGTQGTDFQQDPNNSRVFVGCLDESVTCEDLQQAFSPYGEIVDVKVLAWKRCGFVTYSNRASAEEAIRMLNGSQLGGNSIRVSYGRHSTNKQDQWNDGHHGRPPCYGPSGFGWSPQDPYACAQIGHAGYGYFQQKQPQVQVKSTFHEDQGELVVQQQQHMFP